MDGKIVATMAIEWSNVKDLDKLNLVKFVYGGVVLGSSKFSLLPQLSQNIMLASKVVKADSKIIISLCKSKYVIHFVAISKVGYP